MQSTKLCYAGSPLSPVPCQKPRDTRLTTLLWRRRRLWRVIAHLRLPIATHLRQRGRCWIICMPGMTIQNWLLRRESSLVIIIIVPTDRPTSSLHHFPTAAKEYHKANDAKGKKSHCSTDANPDFLTACKTIEDVCLAAPVVAEVAGVAGGTAASHGACLIADVA